MHRDPILQSMLVIALVQTALTLGMIFGWIQLGQGSYHDFVAALLSFLLPISGAILARYLIDRDTA
jgi:hypothetical protein